jgi:hypothetical protein
MDLRAVQVLCMAVSTILAEMAWDPYGPEALHAPRIRTAEDCHRLDLLMDMMGTLTRFMDTRLTFVTTEGKVIREWIERILELGGRYRRELLILEEWESRIASMHGTVGYSPTVDVKQKGALPPGAP